MNLLLDFDRKRLLSRNGLGPFHSEGVIHIVQAEIKHLVNRLLSLRSNGEESRGFASNPILSFTFPNKIRPFTFLAGAGQSLELLAGMWRGER